MSRRALRVAANIASAFLLLAGILTLAWWAILPQVAAHYALAELQRLGIPIASLQVDRVWLNGVRLSAITIGDRAATIDRIDLDIDPLRLWREQRIDGVTVAGATVRVSIGADGSLVLPGIALGGGRGETLVLPQVPVDRITLSDSRVVVTTPYGDVDAPLSLTLRPQADGGLSLDGTITLRHDRGQVGAGLRAEIAADGSLTGSVDLREGRLSLGTIAAEEVSGWASLAGSIAGLRDVAGELTVGRLAVGAARLADLSLQFGGAGLPDWVSLRGSAGDGTMMLQADATITGWPSDPRAAAELSIQAADLSALPALAGQDLPLTGSGRVDVTADLSVISALDGEVSGQVSVALDRATLAGLFSDLTGTIGADVTLGSGGATVATTAPWSLAGRIEGWPDIVHVQLPKGGAATADWHRDGWTVRLETAIDLASAGRRARIEGGFRLAGSDQAALTWLARDASIDVAPWAVDGLLVSTDGLRLNGAGGLDDMVLSVAGPLTLSGEIDGVAIGRAVADLRGALSRSDGIIAYRGSGCQPVALDGAAIGTTALSAVLGCIVPDGDPLVAVDDQGRIRSASFHVVHNPIEVALGSSNSISMNLPDLDVSASQEGWRVGLAGGGLDWPGAGLAATGLGGTLVTGADPLHAELSVDSFSIPGNALAPLRLRLNLDLGDRDTLAFAGTAHGADGQLTASFTGRHDLANDSGSLAFQVAPILFASAGLQPSAVLPLARDWPIEKVAGQVTVDGSIRWGDRPGTAARVHLADVALRTGDIGIVGLNGDLDLSSLSPLRMPAGQRLTAAAVDVGLLLEDAVAEFGIGRGDMLQIDRLEAHWAGGLLSAEPFAASLDAPQIAATLRADGIDLGRLSTQLDIDGLSISGKVGGLVPVRQQGSALRIDHAELVATEPGIIRYQPSDEGAGLAAASGAAEEGGGLDLLMTALQQFHYGQLSVTLDGTTGQDLQVGLKILGANPDLYDGYPVALNVNLSGALDQILRRSLETTRYADQLQEMFLDGISP